MAVLSLSTSAPSPPARGRGDAWQPQRALSDREVECIGLLADGLTDKEMASRLDVSVRTVRFHFLNIKRSMKVRTRAHAVAVALRQGVVQFLLFAALV